MVNVIAVVVAVLLEHNRESQHNAVLFGVLWNFPIPGFSGCLHGIHGWQRTVFSSVVRYTLGRQRKIERSNERVNGGDREDRECFSDEIIGDRASTMVEVPYLVLAYTTHKVNNCLQLGNIK